MRFFLKAVPNTIDEALESGLNRRFTQSRSGTSPEKTRFCLLYRIYAVFTTLALVFALPLLPLCLLRRSWRYRLGERFGLYGQGRAEDGSCGEASPLVWIHAASVGEVKAAAALLERLRALRPDSRYLVTTTTEQGHRQARRQMPLEIDCAMAPLDVGLLVRRAIRRAQPTLYVCMETELWPNMLVRARRSGAALALMNGRLSERSRRRYGWVGGMMRFLLRLFKSIGAISAADRQRYIALGADPHTVTVTGNIKYSQAGKGDGKEIRARYAALLALDKRKKVWACGSTRSGEEEILLTAYSRLIEQDADFLLVLAPRHLARIERVSALLRTRGLSHHRLSELRQGAARIHGVVLVDTMGELADLYAIADFVFIGGSLVNKGGHNVMEPAAWGRPVLYGPCMADFRDAAELLEAAGAGFPVRGAEELTEKILAFVNDKEGYAQAGRRAAAVVAAQKKAVETQAGLILDLLDGRAPRHPPAITHIQMDTTT